MSDDVTKTCLRCGAPLKGGPLNQCSKCGQPFNPDDAETFDTAKPVPTPADELAEGARQPGKSVRWQSIAVGAVIYVVVVSIVLVAVGGANHSETDVDSAVQRRLVKIVGFPLLSFSQPDSFIQLCLRVLANSVVWGFGYAIFSQSWREYFRSEEADSDAPQ